MEQITLSDAWGWVLAAATAVVALSKAREILKKKLHPEADMREEIRKHSQNLATDDRRLKRLEEKQEDTERFQAVMCRVMLAQLNHELSGNDVTSLKKARDELNEYLTDR